MFAATLIALLVAGSTNAPANDQPPPVWNVHSGDSYCSIIHHPRTDPDLTVMFRLVARDKTADIMFTRTGWAPDHVPPRRIRISLDGEPSATIGAVGTATFPRPGDAPLIAARIVRSDVDRFLEGRRLSVSTEDGQSFVVTPASGDRLRTALRTCEDEQVTAWGLDPEQPPAEPIDPASFLTYTDYPISALREERQGSVRVLTIVAPTGQVSECRILASSGHADLDAATCHAIRRRGRFERFVGPDRIYVSRADWRIPR